MPSTDQFLKVLPILGAIGTFGWGIYQYNQGQRQQADTRRIEATKPFLERQLTLYTEATRVASTIATVKESNKRDQALERFWSLYWGELALVEDEAVESAMAKLGSALGAKAPEGEVQVMALDLAHACRNSLSRSWGVTDWKSPR